MVKTKRVAALDLGTNSFLCLAVEGDQSGIKKILSDEVEIVRLGEGVQKNKKFSEAALHRAEQTLTKFKKTIDQHQITEVLASATSAARDVENGHLLFEIGKKLNIPIEIISGDREAELTFQGALSGNLNPASAALVIDIGGGSTELILGDQQNRIQLAKSLDIGGVRLTEKFISGHPLQGKEIQEAELHIEDELNKYLKLLGNKKTDYAIAVAGTPTALVQAIKGRFIASEIDGYFLSLEELEKWFIQLSERSVQQRIDELNIEKGRADILPIGVLILKKVIQKIQLPGVFVSTRGVRYGLAYEMLQK